VFASGHPVAGETSDLQQTTPQGAKDLNYPSSKDRYFELIKD
jgi:phage/plasmid primase-like uncharacterized protein